MEERIKIYLRLEGDSADRFSRIKDYMGLKADTEVLRSLINWFWREHREELQPTLEHFNLNEDGVMVLDRDLKRVVQVYFKPDTVVCELCGASCRHIEFALSLPEVHKILREKGWMAPLKNMTLSTRSKSRTMVLTHILYARVVENPRDQGNF